jgi:hypothetical protein
VRCNQENDGIEEGGDNEKKKESDPVAKKLLGGHDPSGLKTPQVH